LLTDGFSGAAKKKKKLKRVVAENSIMRYDGQRYGGDEGRPVSQFEDFRHYYSEFFFAHRKTCQRISYSIYNQ